MVYKKALKRFMTAVLAGTMVVSLAACGEGNSGAETKAAGGNTKAAASGETDGTAAASGDTFDPYGKYEDTVSLAIGRRIVQNPKMPDGADYENNAYTKWVEDRFNVKISDAFEALDGEDYDRQVSLAMASEELPDLMVVGKDILDELVANDLVADLTDSYNNYATDYIKDIYTSYDDRCLGTATFEGKLMALPATAPDDAPCQAWIRQDWVDQLGLKVDEDGDSMITRDELEKIAQEFMANDPAGTGNPVGMAFAYTMDGSSNLGITGIANSFGAFQKKWFANADGTIYNGSTTPEMKETLSYLSGLFEKGIIDPQFGTRTWDDIMALMTNGQTGISFGLWHIPDWMLNNVRSMDPNAQYKSYAVADANGKVSVPHNNAASAYVVVRKEYENPEVAVKLVNLMHDERVTSNTLPEDVISYEVAGVDGSVRPLATEINSSYSLLNDFHAIVDCVDGKITAEELPTLEAKNVVECVNAYKADPSTTDVTNWARYHSRMEGIQLIDTLTKNDAFNWVDPVYPGTTETMKSAKANLDKLEEEIFIKIITGELSADDFDSFIESWNSQGGAAICEEITASMQ